MCSLIRSSSERSQLKVEATNNGVGGCWGKGCPPVILALEKPREEVLSQPRLHSNLKTIKHQITHTHTHLQEVGVGQGIYKEMGRVVGFV